MIGTILVHTLRYISAAFDSILSCVIYVCVNVYSSPDSNTGLSPPRVRVVTPLRILVPRTQL
jgi:hypothetical protein